MGLLNGGPDPRFNATFSTVFPPPGHLAFVSQPGGLGLAALGLFTGPSLGVSGFVSVGNTADLTPNDLLLYWDEDPGTSLILAYLESVPDPRRFARIARRILPAQADRGSEIQPIPVLGAGRRPRTLRLWRPGRRRSNALVHQAGVIRADTVEEMFDVAAVMSSQPVPAGQRVAVLTNVGGPDVLVADACEAAGLLVPELSHDIQTGLRAGLPAQAAVKNPVDVVAGTSAEHYGRAMRLLGAAEEIDAIIAVFIPVGSPRRGLRPGNHCRCGRPARQAGHRGLHDDRARASWSVRDRHPLFTRPEQAATALGHIARWAEWRARPAGHVVIPPGIDPARGRAAINVMLASQPGGGWADAKTAGELLAAYGISAARSRLVRTAAQAAAAQAEVGGPVAVKIAAAIHKSDVGGVALGIDSPHAAAEAVTAIRAILTEAGIAEHAAEFLIQEPVRDGVEMIVGVTHDPAFGPLVLAAWVARSSRSSVTSRCASRPLSDTDVDEMLRSLRSYRLLTGYRHSPRWTWRRSPSSCTGSVRWSRTSPRSPSLT